MGPNRPSTLLSLRQGAAGHRACEEWLEEPVHGTRRTPLEFQARSLEFLVPPRPVIATIARGRRQLRAGALHGGIAPPTHIHTHIHKHTQGLSQQHLSRKVFPSKACHGYRSNDPGAPSPQHLGKNHTRPPLPAYPVGGLAASALDASMEPAGFAPGSAGRLGRWLRRCRPHSLFPR